MVLVASTNPDLWPEGVPLEGGQGPVDVGHGLGRLPGLLVVVSLDSRLFQCFSVSVGSVGCVRRVSRVCQ